MNPDRRPVFKDRFAHARAEERIEVIDHQLDVMESIEWHLECLKDRYCDAADEGVVNADDYWQAADILLDNIRDDMEELRKSREHFCKMYGEEY